MEFECANKSRPSNYEEDDLIVHFLASLLMHMEIKIEKHFVSNWLNNNSRNTLTLE